MTRKIAVRNPWVDDPEPEQNDAGRTATPPRGRPKLHTEPQIDFHFKLGRSLAARVHNEVTRRKMARESNASIVGVFQDLVKNLPG